MKKAVAILLLLGTALTAQIKYDGGALYREWPVGINQTACQIELITTPNIAEKRDPIQYILLVHHFEGDISMLCHYFLWALTLIFLRCQ